MAEKLTNQNILIICPKFFGYEKIIRDKINNLKCNKSYLIYENINGINLFFRFILKYLRKIETFMLDIYYKIQLKKIKNVNIVFIIKGSTISIKIMKIMKSRFKNATYIMYQWDSI